MKNNLFNSKFIFHFPKIKYILPKFSLIIPLKQIKKEELSSIWLTIHWFFKINDLKIVPINLLYKNEGQKITSALGLNEAEVILSTEK